MNQQECNSSYTIFRLIERLRDADNFNYQDACRAADVIEWHTELIESLRDLYIWANTNDQGDSNGNDTAPLEKVRVLLSKVNA